MSASGGQFLGRIVAFEAADGLPTHGDGFSGEWSDMLGTFDQGSGVGALQWDDYRASGFKMFFVRHDQPDVIYQKYQFSHEWDRSSVRLHAHVIPVATWVPGPATKDVYWEIAYAWSDDGQLVASPAGWTTVNATLTLTPSDQYKRKYCALATIAPTGNSKESSTLLVRVTRLGTSGSDTYADNKTDPGLPQANLALEYFDVHYQKNKPGTVNEAPP